MDELNINDKLVNEFHFYRSYYPDGNNGNGTHSFKVDFYDDSYPFVKTGTIEIKFDKGMNMNILQEAVKMFREELEQIILKKEME